MKHERIELIIDPGGALVMMVLAACVWRVPLRDRSRRARNALVTART